MVVNLKRSWSGRLRGRVPKRGCMRGHGRNKINGGQVGQIWRLKRDTSNTT